MSFSTNGNCVELTIEYRFLTSYYFHTQKREQREKERKKTQLKLLDLKLIRMQTFG